MRKLGRGEGKGSKKIKVKIVKKMRDDIYQTGTLEVSTVLNSVEDTERQRSNEYSSSPEMP